MLIRSIALLMLPLPLVESAAGIATARAVDTPETAATGLAIRIRQSAQGNSHRAIHTGLKRVSAYSVAQPSAKDVIVSVR
jgi:hypothetical protein